MLETILIIVIAFAASVGFFRVIEGWSEIGNIDDDANIKETDEWPT